MNNKDYIPQKEIPVALVEMKALGTPFKPVGKTCVPVSVKQELENRKAKDQVNRYLG